MTRNERRRRRDERDEQGQRKREGHEWITRMYSRIRGKDFPLAGYRGCPLTMNEKSGNENDIVTRLEITIISMGRKKSEWEELLEHLCFNFIIISAFPAGDDEADERISRGWRAKRPVKVIFPLPACFSCFNEKEREKHLTKKREEEDHQDRDDDDEFVVAVVASTDDEMSFSLSFCFSLIICPRFCRISLFPLFFFFFPLSSRSSSSCRLYSIVSVFLSCFFCWRMSRSFLCNPSFEDNERKLFSPEYEWRNEGDEARRGVDEDTFLRTTCSDAWEI